jgi:hypothetical protein
MLSVSSVVTCTPVIQCQCCPNAAMHMPLLTGNAAVLRAVLHYCGPLCAIAGFCQAVREVPQPSAPPARKREHLPVHVSAVRAAAAAAPAWFGKRMCLLLSTVMQPTHSWACRVVRSRV